MLRFLAALALLPAAGATRAAALGRASAYDHALGRWGRRLSALMAVAAAAGAEVGELPRSLLEMIDADGDGKIDVEEFIQIAPKDAGDEISEAMRATYARVFKKADIDGDGSLSGREAEYAAFLVAHESVEESPGAKKHLSTAAATIDFSRLDTNNDWKLDKELGYFIEEHARELGLWSGRGSPEFTEWVDWLFDQADITGDGVLELKEFEHASFLLEHRIAGIAKDVQGGLVKALTHTMFAELDADGDGVIDKAFKRFLPLGDRILVAKVAAEATSTGGILLPEAAKQEVNQARVLAVGPGRRGAKGDLMPMTTKVGDVVVIPQYGGSGLKLEGEEYHIYRDEDIVGIIREE